MITPQSKPDEQDKELSEFERFKNFARRIIAVPKKDIAESVKREREKSAPRRSTADQQREQRPNASARRR